MTIARIQGIQYFIIEINWIDIFQHVVFRLHRRSLVISVEVSFSELTVLASITFGNVMKRLEKIIIFPPVNGTPRYRWKLRIVQEQTQLIWHARRARVLLLL